MSDILVLNGKMTIAQSEVMKALVACLPYPQHISNVDLGRGDDLVYLMWTDTTYRIHYQTETNTAFVEEVNGASLIGTDKAKLIQALVNLYWGRKGV